MNPKHWKEYDLPAVIRRRAQFAKAELTQAPPAPKARLLDRDWQYTRAAETDVLKTFRRFGWIPPTEQAMRARWELEQTQS